jgi:hypothetical protein
MFGFKRGRTAAFVVGLLIFFLAFVPFPSLRAPDWDVWVIDERGDPLQGITVRESYRDYSAEFQGGEEDLKTDNQGHVRFPAKTLRASSVQRLMVIASSAADGVHAGFGPHDYVFAFGNGLQGADVGHGVVVDWTGSPAVMESHIVMRPSAIR